MTPASVILPAVRVSIGLTVMALGLNSTMADTTYLVRRPKELLKAVLSMNVVMPAIAVSIALAFNLYPAVKIALVALSVAPIPPILPRKALKAGGHTSYTMGLLVAAALLSIVFIPLVLEVLQLIFHMQLGIKPASIAMLVLMTIVGPLALGILIHHFAPAFAGKIAKPVAVVGAVLLLVSALPIVITSFHDIVSLIGNGTILAIAAFVIVGFAAGYLLGGPDPGDRTVLALSTSSRHPGIAVAVAHTNFPDQKLALAAIALYLFVNVIVVAPAIRWAKRRQPAPARI